MKCRVKNGPFAGVEVRLSDLVRSIEDNGPGALLWPVVLRHPIFVAVFPPTEGYAVSVTVTDGGQQQTFDPSGSPYQDAHGEPIKAEAKIFTATLTKAGELIAQASTQQTLEVRKAWEMGENNAKSRLYESLGLPAAFQQHDIVQDAKPTFEGDVAVPATEPNKASAVVQALGVRPVPASVKAVKPEQPVPNEGAATQPSETAQSREPQKPEGVSASMWAQLKQACARKGVPMPEVSNNQDAVVALSEVNHG